MRYVKHYVVEMRDPDTGYWVEQMRVAPAYQWVEKIYPFLWFWKVKRREIENEYEAHHNARRRAIFQAKSFVEHRREDARIKQVWADQFRGEEYTWSREIWLNGKFLD
jgi:hypothetical protein